MPLLRCPDCDCGTDRLRQNLRFCAAVARSMPMLKIVLLVIRFPNLYLCFVLTLCPDVTAAFPSLALTADVQHTLMYRFLFPRTTSPCRCCWLFAPLASPLVIRQHSGPFPARAGCHITHLFQ